MKAWVKNWENVKVILEWTVWPEKWQKLVCTTTKNNVGNILEELKNRNPMVWICNYKITEILGINWKILFSDQEHIQNPLEKEKRDN